MSLVRFTVRPPRLFHWLLPLCSALTVPQVMAQGFPFTSGPIPPCDTSTFTANVSGVGWLITPNGWDFGPYLQSVILNITTDHPQTLQISLTSPAGTTLLLSAFNGAGGQNYTNTEFSYWGWNNITLAAAPFTNSYYPQGGTLDVFSGQNANGIWTITVIDTACAGGSPGPGGGWNPGWFNGAAAGGGAFAFGFSSPPPPCGGWLGDNTSYICQGATVDILGYYNWQLPGSDLTVYDGNGVPVPDATAVGTADWYYVEAYDPWDGCLYWGNYEVIVYTPITLGPDQNVEQCSSGGPVNLAALFNLAGVTTAWSLDGVSITNAMATAATAPGVYQLIGSNLGGCTDTVLVTLNSSADPVLGPDQTLGLCPGGSVDLGSLYNTVGYNVEWTYGGNVFGTPEAAVDAGAYTLVVTTAAGCTDTAVVTLNVDAPPALGADQALDLCANEVLDLTTLYTTTGSTASWTIAGVPVADPSAVSAAGVYQLVVTSVANCTDTALVSVNELPSPALGADAATALCAGNTADLNALYATTGLNTLWTLAGTVVGDPSSVDVAGTYTLIATNAAGCSDTALVQVSISANPVLGPDQYITVCEGTLVDLTALYATGINTTTWSSNGVPVADPTSVPGSGNYTLTATNAAGCASTAEVSLQVDPSPALGADQSLSICVGSSFDLTSLYTTTGLAGTWTLGAAAVNDPTTASVAGSYQLVVTNSFGCSDTAVVALSLTASPSLGADQFFTLCPWQSVDLGAVFPVAGLNVTYLLDGEAVADPSAVSTTGTYVITATDANGCTDEALATVVAVDCLCVADFAEDAQCLQEPVQFTLLADSAIVSAYWEFNGAGPNSAEIDPAVRFHTGEVLVTLYATLSCGTVTVERSIRVPDCSDSCSVFVPSAFTPDGDGINDSWTWNGECVPKDFSMEVFNRFGELIFASKDPYTTWDGTYRGVQSPVGVYAYRVGYRLPYQDRKEVMGAITLVR